MFKALFWVAAEELHIADCDTLKIKNTLHYIGCASVKSHDFGRPS